MEVFSMKNLGILIVLSGIIISGCGGQSTTESVESKPAIATTQAVQPSPTEKIPTFTPTVTKTKLPPTATRTTTLTLTSAPETEPIIFTGTGDSIVDIDKPSGPMLVHIVGNTSSRYFGVISYDINNERIDLLVNTTEPYDGIRPLDFLDDQWTARFEVSARGEWTIEVLPLSHIRYVEVPGIIEGNGDDVFLLAGGTPDLAIIKGNEEGRYFGVIGWYPSRDLLVNTTDPYEGTVMLDQDTVIIEVIATGAWQIEITEK
jgi:hypothetical protein